MEEEYFDVIIVGAGPAGLRCAEILSKSEYSVLLLDKKEEIGSKICAGGITIKDTTLMEIPPHLLEIQVQKATLFSSCFSATTSLNQPFVYTINRKDFGQWQLSKLKNSSIQIRTKTRVTAIAKNFITVNHSEKIGYRYLVGADGPSSIVRRYLHIPIQKQLVTFQYRIPWQAEPRFEITIDSRFFYTGYAWVFPHKNELVVGCGVNPKLFSHRKLRANFERWLAKSKFDTSHALYESFPINYDYRGFHFGNLFLAGEAAGLSSGLTGEGIFQALVSGEEIAKTILQPNYVSHPMKEVVHYNRLQEKIVSFFHKMGPFRNGFFNLIVWLMHNKRFNHWVTKGFAGT